MTSEVFFDPVAHTYSLHGQKARTSVTGLISTFMPPFDRDRILETKFRKKRKKADEELAHDEILTDDKKYKNMTKEQILTQWDSGRNAGTSFHAEIERFLLLGSVPEEREEQEKLFTFPEKRLFLDFYQQFKQQGWTLHATEQKLFDTELGLAGTVDAVFKRKGGERRLDWEEDETEEEDEEYCCVDWKRSKANLSDFSGGRKCYYPIQHLNDCTLTKYSLQGNIYAHLLKKLHGLNVTEIYIVKFPPNGRKFTSIRVPVWEKEVTSMLDHFQQHCALKDTVERWESGLEQPSFLPPLTGSF